MSMYWPRLGQHKYPPGRQIFFAFIVVLLIGCSESKSNSSSPASTKNVPLYSPATFYDDLDRLISRKQYATAVLFVQSANPKSQADYDRFGYCAVAGDKIFLPGVGSDIWYDQSRDREMPGTQDVIEDIDWQKAAYEFANEYNRYRAGK